MANEDALLSREEWQLAVWSQEASNLSGLAHGLSRVIAKVWAEARAQGKGTDWVNTHPIVRLYVEQMYHLASRCDYFEAYRVCEERAGEDLGGACAMVAQPV